MPAEALLSRPLDLDPPPESAEDYRGDEGVVIPAEGALPRAHIEAEACGGEDEEKEARGDPNDGRPTVFIRREGVRARRRRGGSRGHVHRCRPPGCRM